MKRRMSANTAPPATTRRVESEPPPVALLAGLPAEPPLPVEVRPAGAGAAATRPTVTLRR
jgi:hypothetical protein